MECNRDEATRAKELAELKFAEKDFDGAKKNALKAQKLYPELDGLPQLLATIDVYISFGKIVNGVVDWYSVLGVEPFADDDTIWQHYRQLAQILHPDKNRSVGVEGAFKIVSEAWSLLSDEDKRIAYDKKWNGKLSTSVPTGENGVHDFSNNNNLTARHQRNATFPKCPPPHFQPKLDTFWTICNACKMQFGYLRTYLNNNLVCPGCHQPFLAIEIIDPPSVHNISSAPWANGMQQQNFNQNIVTGNSYPQVRKPAPATDVRSGLFSKLGSPQCAVPTSPAAPAVCMVQPSCEQFKGDQEEAVTAFIKGEARGGNVLSSRASSAGVSSMTEVYRPKKKRHKGERMVKTNEREMANQIFMGSGGVGMSGPENGSSETGKVKLSGYQKGNCSRELPLLEIQKLLMNKAKKEIRWKLDEWSKDVLKTSRESRSSSKEMKDKREEVRQDLVNGVKADCNKIAESVNSNSAVQTERSAPADSDSVPVPDNLDTDPTAMSVPDPDFHDFDQDRTEKSFGEGQVWAAYDDDDGMPRYYAMIQSVISLKPFKMRISWLNSKSNSELSPLNWVCSGFRKTSGDFWRGKYEFYYSLNSFSHKVTWTKGTRGAIQIFPRKGQVWALYRNWSADWNQRTPDEVIHKYDMVEVLEDYIEKTGVTVVPLIKVPGFKTVFYWHMEQSKTRTIPKEEIFRFSHQVPSYLLTGQEGRNAPKGCLELDPASTPLELLQVLTEAQLEELEIAKKAKEDYPLDGMENVKKEELVENGETTKGRGIAEDVHKRVEAEAMMTKRKDTGEEKTIVYKRRQKQKQESKLSNGVEC